MMERVGNWGHGTIWQIVSGDFPSNAYFCEADVPGGGILIDAGLDGVAVDRLLREQGLSPWKIFCTHGHFDHAGGSEHLQCAYGCEVVLHKADERTVKSSNFLLMSLKIPARVKPPRFSWIEGAASFRIPDGVLEFAPAPGHTPGSCIIKFGSAWFTGDTLYSRGIGLSGLPGEDQKRLRESILALWPDLNADTVVFPGHGRPADGASIKAENRDLLNFLGVDPS